MYTLHHTPQALDNYERELRLCWHPVNSLLKETVEGDYSVSWEKLIVIYYLVHCGLSDWYISHFHSKLRIYLLDALRTKVTDTAGCCLHSQTNHCLMPVHIDKYTCKLHTNSNNVQQSFIGL